VPVRPLLGVVMVSVVEIVKVCETWVAPSQLLSPA